MHFKTIAWKPVSDNWYQYNNTGLFQVYSTLGSERVASRAKVRHALSDWTISLIELVSF